MNYKGVIIEKSLESKDVLGNVMILSTKIEEVTEKHKTPWIRQWTLHTVEMSEDRGEEIAEKLSQALDSQHAWYADFKNEKFHYVIFRNKAFREAMEYGISLGIPWYQLDFSPEIEEWKRD